MTERVTYYNCKKNKIKCQIKCACIRVINTTTFFFLNGISITASPNANFDRLQKHIATHRNVAHASRLAALSVRGKRIQSQCENDNYSGFF